MQDYIDRLLACGVRLDNAMVIVNDFMRELDFDGLADFCARLENVGSV